MMFKNTKLTIVVACLLLAMFTITITAMNGKNQIEPTVAGKCYDKNGNSYSCHAMVSHPLDIIDF